jgi:hypothetical protein
LAGLLLLPLTGALGLAGGASPSDTALRDIPALYLAAYQRAVEQRCPTLPWTVLAAIGKVESDHGRSRGAVTQPDGQLVPPIIGVALDGTSGNRAIGDTDGGLFDSDPVHDRAVGPMQFLPSTWAHAGVDATGDGRADPHNALDAAHAAARYLCEAGAGDPGRLRGAIWTYNNSWEYVDTVLGWAARYSTAIGSGPADPVLVAAVLSNPRLEIYIGGRTDIAEGRIDNRVLLVLQLATEHWSISVSSLQTGHSKCVGGGSYEGCNVSNHWEGRAFDVHRVGGQPVDTRNDQAYEFTVWLSSLPAELVPDGVGSPWADLQLPGYFHDAAHRHHVHVGYDR